MPIDTLFVYTGVYTDQADALADYDAVKDLHTKAGLIDAYDAAVVEHRTDGKVKIVKKHETPTRAGGVSLDSGQAGLVVVAVSDMEAKVRSAMHRAEKLQEKQLKADQDALEADAKAAQQSEKG